MAGAEGVRKAMRHTSTMTNRTKLPAMTPPNDLASTQYSLANPKKECLVYLRDGGDAVICLSKE